MEGETDCFWMLSLLYTFQLLHYTVKKNQVQSSSDKGIMYQEPEDSNCEMHNGAKENIYDCACMWG